MLFGEISSRFLPRTKIARHCARLIATFSRLVLNRNSVPLGASAPFDVAIETMAT